MNSWFYPTAEAIVIKSLHSMYFILLLKDIDQMRGAIEFPKH